MIAGWFDDLEQEVRGCFAGGSLSPEQLATRLGVPTAAAVSFILLLAAENRLRIERVSMQSAERAESGRVHTAADRPDGAPAHALSRAA